MKQAVYFLMLVTLLAGCAKEESTPTQPLAMSAVVNGQQWEANGRVYKAVAQVYPDYSSTPTQYSVAIEGASGEFLPLGLETLDIALAANYLPKVGRHPINFGDGGFIGPPNPNYRQLQAQIRFRLPNGNHYSAQATSGFLEITSVTNTQVTGNFELMGTTTQPAGNAPKVLQIQNGKFCAQVIGTSDKYILWDAEQ